LLLIVGVGYYFLNKYFHFSIPCLFHEITGFYCPGCGITRMLFSLFRLEIYQAFRYNPLVFILFFSYIFYKILQLFDNKIIIKEKYIMILLVIVIVYGILRNMPGFEYLIPTKI